MISPRSCCGELRRRLLSAGSRRLCSLADMRALPAGKTLINCYHRLFISTCSHLSFPVFARHHVSFCPIFCHSDRCLLSPFVTLLFTAVSLCLCRSLISVSLFSSSLDPLASASFVFCHTFPPFSPSFSSSAADFVCPVVGGGVVIAAQTACLHFRGINSGKVAALKT